MEQESLDKTHIGEAVQNQHLRVDPSDGVPVEYPSEQDDTECIKLHFGRKPGKENLDRNPIEGDWSVLRKRSCPWKL
jgi:hypothetical protein